MFPGSFRTLRVMCLGQGQNAKSQYTFWFLSHCGTITVHMSDSNSSTDSTSALATLLTEARYKPSERIDELSTTEMLQVMNAADREVADAVAREIPAIARAVDAIAAALAPERGGQLFYVGAGTSGRLGVLDASECPPTFNVPSTLVQGLIAGGEYALRHSVEGAEDSPELGATDLRSHGFGAKDVLAGIAASGRTPYVLGAMEYARSLGAITIGVSCVPESAVARAAEIAITPAVGPEVVTGSTRLRAGTATKLVLNMLSTGAMIRLGTVYSNLMVNVQPTNEKLADRAERIVVELTGLPRERAGALFREAGSIKAAVLMHAHGLRREKAEALLRDAQGHLRHAMEAAAQSKN
jgi:N-acetylmuramic acid 6-phosphate etherase